MRLLHSGEQQELRTNRINSAREKIEREFSWKAVGDRIKQSVEAARLGNESIRVTHLTTFNSRCGIAEYSSLLLNGLPQNVKSTVVADRGSWPLDFGIEEEIVRLWEQVRHQDVQPLVTALRLSDSDIIHLQHNYGFFSMEDLSDLVQRLNGAKPLVITLHRTKDLDRGHEIVSLAHATDALRKVDAIIVHEEHDVRRLADFGISGNVVHIPHAAMPFKGTPKNRVFTPGRELRLGTFGFLLPHKGLETSLAALHSLNYRGIPASLTALCSLHPDPTSAQTHERINDMIGRWNLSSLIHLDTGYKTVEEIHTDLSDVDILLLPYAQTEESSSGVLAMLLGIGKPIIATDLDIFSGSRDALKLVPAPAKDDDVTSAIVELINDPAKMRELGRKAHQRALDISWGAIGRETFHLYRSLLQK
jgi:glycosyltransferase involved in cell wall biosynthesis